MTDKQIKQAENALPVYSKMTDEQKTLYAELSCRRMINSILVYGGVPYDEQEDKLNNYLEDYTRGDKTLFYVPRERILELVREQQEDFKNAIVRRGVYTDYEGCTYNSVIWADDYTN